MDASNTICTSVTTATNGNVPQGNFAYGDEYICKLGDGDAKTFYVLETNGNNVSLIMNANVDSSGKSITSTTPTDKGVVAWVSKEDYIAAGGTESDYGVNGNNNLGPVTLKSTLKTSTKGWVRLESNQITLPTASQITAASGKTFNNSSVTGLSTWLYDYLNSRPNSVSGVYGYWTSTEDNSNSMLSYKVDLSNTLNSIPVITSGTIGIRPVITIPKSQIK